MRFLKILSGILAAVMFMLSAVSGLGFADGTVVTSGDIGSTSTSSDLMISSVSDTSVSSDISVSSDESEPEMNSIIDEETGLMFTLLEDGTYAVGVHDTEEGCLLELEGKVVVPGEFNGKKVTKFLGLMGCEKITSVEISEGITEMCGRAFVKCFNLKEITIPSSLKVIDTDNFEFWACNSLMNVNVSEDNENFCSVDGIVFTKDKSTLMLYPAGRPEKNYIVPDYCKTMFTNAFLCCNNLTSITIPEGVVKISERAIEHCENLENINIPASIVELFSEAKMPAIDVCPNLKTIIVDTGNPFYCTVDGVLFSKDMTQLLMYPSGKTDEEYAVPDGVTSMLPVSSTYTKLFILPKSLKCLDSILTNYRYPKIRYGGTLNEWEKLSDGLDFSKFTIVCSDDTIYSEYDADENGLIYQLLDDGTYSVGVDSTENGNQLDIEGDFIVPNEFNGKKVTAISGLYGLYKVTSITVPEGIKQIDGFSFGGCLNLKRIFLPKSFESLVYSSFFLWDCDNLESVDVSEENEYFCSVDGIVFTKDKSTLILYPPGKPATTYAVPDTCKTISTGAFSECNKLTSLIIPEGVDEIKPQAVDRCVNLKNIVFGGTLSEWTNLVSKISLDDYDNDDIKAGVYAVICAGETTESKDDSSDETTSGDASSSTSSNESDPNTITPITSEPSSSGIDDSNTSEPINNESTSSEDGETSNPTSYDSTNGDVSQNVDTEEYVPKAKIKTPNGALVEAVLTETELEQYKNGADVRVVVEASDAENSVSDFDKQLAEKALSTLGYIPGRYFDFKLFKTIDSGNKTQVEETNAPITLSLEIPETLRATGREYYMLRIHGGEATVLRDYDDSIDTITIRTDRFSIYVLAYSDSAANVDNSQSGVKNPYTGKDSYVGIYLRIGIVSFVVFIILCLFTGKNGMTEKQKDRKFAKLIVWGKGGGRIRSVVALAAIFVLLSFYYGIGMKTSEK